MPLNNYPYPEKIKPGDVLHDTDPTGEYNAHFEPELLSQRLKDGLLLGVPDGRTGFLRMKFGLPNVTGKIVKLDGGDHPHPFVNGQPRFDYRWAADERKIKLPGDEEQALWEDNSNLPEYPPYRLLYRKKRLLRARVVPMQNYVEPPGLEP